MAADMILPGVRLVQMLDGILRGNRAFDGAHALATLPSFNALYPDSYHNYFCANGKDFKLVLHPDVKPFAEMLQNTSVMKHCWFGSNTDPVVGITAAMVAECIDRNKRESLECDESLTSPGWVDASGKMWPNKEAAVVAIFGTSELADIMKSDDLVEDDSTFSDDLLDSDTFSAVKGKLVIRFNESSVSDDWLREGVRNFFDGSAFLTDVNRDELSELLVGRLMYETDDESDEDDEDAWSIAKRAAKRRRKA